MSVESLLREREGYVRRGLPDRVAQVDTELAKLGYAVETATAVPAVEVAAVRRGRPKSAPAGS